MGQDGLIQVTAAAREGQVKHWAGQVIARWGQIDIPANNAGTIFLPARLLVKTPEGAR